MYIRLNTFSVGTAGVRSSRGWLIVLLPSSGLRKASQSVTVFEADTAAGEYGSLSLWDTREDAEAADAALNAAVTTGRGWSWPGDARNTDPAHR